MWDELLMELRPWSECDLKALFLSRRQPPLNACGHSVYYKLIVPITSIAFVFPEFFVSPSKKFFLWRIQCRMSPKTAYFSYWSEMTHSAIFWLLVTWFLESAHFPASIPIPSLLLSQGFITWMFLLFSAKYSMPFMTKSLCTCSSLSIPTPPLSDLISVVCVCTALPDFPHRFWVGHILFSFFYKISWKNPNELFGQPNRISHAFSLPLYYYMYSPIEKIPPCTKIVVTLLV